MSRHEPLPLRSNDQMLVAASAKVIAQRLKVEATGATDPQRIYEESLLRSMMDNETSARLLISIGADR